MRFISKVVSAAVLSACLATGAMASDGYYGPAKAKVAASNKAAANFSQVVLHNYTRDGYMAYATFATTGKTVNLHLGSQYSGTDVITYDVNYPDTQVCLNVVRDFDGASVFNNCLSYGNVNVGPYMSANKPAVNVVN